jgi:hypothetical protein
MKIKNLFYTLLALPLFLVACNEAETVDQVKNPTVKVTAGAVTENSLSFTIETTDATNVAYLVVEGSDVPTASEVLANGNAIEANKKIEVTEENLKESTEYVVVAAVQNSKATEKDFIQMTTNATVTPGPGPGEDPEDPENPEDPETPETVEFVATIITTSYEDGDALHYYDFVLSDKEVGSNGWGVANGTYYAFSVISNVKGNGVLPNGTYSLSSTESAGTLDINYTYFYQMDANGDMVDGMKSYKDGNVIISDGKIEANLEFENGDIHKVTFEGKLAVEDGTVDAPAIFEATHTADKWLWGGNSNYGNKYQVIGDGFSVDVHFPAQYASETALTAQTYKWSTTTMFGYNDFVDFTTRSFTVDGKSVAVDGGSAKVEAEGEEYHIEVVLLGRDGFTYMIEYNGKLNDKGDVGGDENATIVFTNFEYVTYNSSVGFFEYKLTNEAGDKMSLRVNDYQANESTILPGSYNWASASMCGNKGFFSTNAINVGGINYKASAGTLVVAEKATLDLTITLTMESGDEMTFTYAEQENGGNEGGSTEPTEPVKLATPSVFGNVEGNTVVISWQEIEGAKDYTVTLEGVETKTVTNAYITYSNLAWDTTYNVSVVANSSDEALYITSDAGTASFTTGTQPEDGGDEGGNEGPVASYENWVFNATLNMGTRLVTCSDGSHTVEFTLSQIAGATFHINGDGTLNATDVKVDGVAAESASGTISMKSEDSYHIVLDAYINGVHYTGKSTNPVV